jgi:hypothetical protein
MRGKLVSASLIRRRNWEKGEGVQSPRCHYTPFVGEGHRLTTELQEVSLQHLPR